MGNKAGRATASKGATSAGGTAGGMTTSAVNAQRAALIDKLASRTEFTTEDVSNLYDEFMNIAAETPSTPNCIQREQFLDVLNKHHVDWRSDLFVEYLFDAFDVCEHPVRDDGRAAGRTLLFHVERRHEAPAAKQVAAWCRHRLNRRRVPADWAAQALLDCLLPLGLDACEAPRRRVRLRAGFGRE